MDEAWSRIFGPDTALCLSSDASAVTLVTTSSQRFLMKTMVTNGTLLMCLLILTSTFVPDFADTSTIFASFAAQLA